MSPALAALPIWLTLCGFIIIKYLFRSKTRHSKSQHEVWTHTRLQGMKKEKTHMQISDGKWDGRHNSATRKAQINTRTHPK